MNTNISAFQDERSSFRSLTLEDIFEPISGHLTQTKKLYKSIVQNSAEKNYIHTLLSGYNESYIPEEFRVSVADRISHHLLQSDGKWIRASLVLLTADACGKCDEAASQVAVAVELLHLATLIHDDIIDEASLRRGVGSIPGQWGNSIAVLYGDFLFCKALKLLLESGSVGSQRLLIQAAEQMCLGEIKELIITEDRCYEERDYLEMIENKTASLMAAACASGGELGRLSEEHIEYLHEYGLSLGMAFQITDDVLDYTASTSILGKEQGWDLRNGKNTLPLIHLNNVKGSTVKMILEREESIDEKANQLLELMRHTGSIDYAYSVGIRYGENARKKLAAVEKEIGSSPSLQSLYYLIEFVLGREQ